MSDNSIHKYNYRHIIYRDYETFYSSIHVTRALEMSNEYGGWHVPVEVYTERWLSERESKKKKTGGH